MHKRGSTDNCYLIKAPGATVLVDLPFEAYQSKFVAALESLTPVSQITHIVITQLDPKAIPCLEALLSKGCKPQVILSNPALRLLQSALGEKPDKAQLLSNMQLVVARSGATVQLCEKQPEQQLQLVLTPTPRWPDLMVVYYPPEQLAFTSKLFSALVTPKMAYAQGNYGPKDLARPDDVGGWEVYYEDWKWYFECMLAPVAKQASLVLDKLAMVPAVAQPTRNRPPAQRFTNWLANILFFGPSSETPKPGNGGTAEEAPMVVRMLAPMHGPVASAAVAQLLRKYRVWVDRQVAASATANVAVLYASAYGNTAALAQAISRGVTKGGVGVTTLNLELVSVEEVAKAIQESNGFVIGSPTLGGHMPTQVQVALGQIVREPSAKTMPCGVFGSFGWSGEAVDEMEAKLKNAAFKFSFDPIRVKFKPTAKDLVLCEDSGRQVALAIKKKLKQQEAQQSKGDQRAALASGPQLAMGRVVGSLAVLTASDEDASGAMLASWISQASFDPPGITVSIKKDRAMEPLLATGNRFNVSMVPEGRERTVMKALAKVFAPGEDRLAGLETVESEENKMPVLKDANAYLECQVVSRMAAGDHIVVYANVLQGKVIKDGVLTAVHHRKVGNHY